MQLRNELTHNAEEYVLAVSLGIAIASNQLQLDATLRIADGQLLNPRHHGAHSLVHAAAIEVRQGHSTRSCRELLVNIISTG